jgi:hypothetical protein
LESFKQSNALEDIGKHRTEERFHFALFSPFKVMNWISKTKPGQTSANPTDPARPVSVSPVGRTHGQ